MSSASVNSVEYARGSTAGLKIFMIDGRGRAVTGFTAPTAGTFVIRAEADGPDLVNKDESDMTFDVNEGSVTVALDAADTDALELGTYLAEASATVDGVQYSSRVFYVELVESMTLSA